MLPFLAGLQGQTAGMLSVRTPRSRAGTHPGCPAQKTHTDRERENFSSYLDCIWSCWTQLSRLVQVTNAAKLNLTKLKSLSFGSSQTDKSRYLLNRNLTQPAAFPSFHTSPLSDYRKFYFLKAPFVDVLLPLHLCSTQHSSFSFPYSSFCVHHLSLPPSPPSALRLTLCWMQPETHSALLFPGSRSLCFQAQPGKTLSSPLPLGVTVSSPPWLSQVLTLSVTHQHTTCW